MASFTDTQPLKFNAYNQQQPVEAMVQVGMAKQKAHEEGIQKIQTQLDNIAGLEVARDVDKAYLQSRLNELGNRLRYVAGGDFSNFQMVSTATGMTRQLINDKGVQNAVSSAARLKKEREFMEEERKKGELNPANEYVFNEQVGAWYNNNDVHASFNAKYDKYFDVDKYMRETFNEVKPSSFTYDEIFQTDGNGQKIIDPVTGGYKLSTVMTKLKKEGRMPEDVKQTLDYIFSDPRVSKQLNINGQYNYRGATNEDLVGRLTATKVSQMDAQDKNILALTMKKNALADGLDKAKASMELEAAVKDRNAAEKNYDELIQNIATNSSAVKGMLYKAEVKNKYQDMYSYVNEERTVHANPAWQAHFDMQKEANLQRYRSSSLALEAQKLKQADEHFYAGLKSDWDIANLKAKGTKTPEELAAEGYVTADVVDSNAIISTHEKQTADSAAEYVKQSNGLIKSLGVLNPDIYAANKAMYPGLSEDQLIERTINETAKATGKNPENYRAELTEKAIQAMQQTKNKMDSNKQGLLRNVNNAKRKYLENVAIGKGAREAFPDPQIDPSKLKPIKVKVQTGLLDFSNGRDVTLSPEDQMNLAAVHNNDGKLFSSTAEEDALAKTARAQLNARGINNHMIDLLRDKIGYAERTAPNKINPKVQSFYNYKKSIDTPQARKTIADRAQYIKERTTYDPSIEKTIGAAKEDKTYLKYVSGMIGRYASTGQNLNENFKGNASNMASAINDEGTVTLRATKDASGAIRYVAKVFDKKSNFVGEMDISPQEASIVNFNPQQLYATGNKKFAEAKMNITRNNTTAFGDIGDVVTYNSHADAALLKDNFKFLKNLTTTDVQGNVLVQDVVDVNGVVTKEYYNYVYVNDLKSGKMFVKQFRDPAPTMDDAIGKMENLSPQVINQMILEYNANKGK